MKIDNYLTHISHPCDLPFLKQKLFDVNMRLFKSNLDYNNLIKNCCDLICNLALTKFEDYKKPHGMSGANAGIPFNIIAIVINRGMENEFAKLMINPKIIKGYGRFLETESNCGSIRLKNPIKVPRDEFIDLEYFDINGTLHIDRNIGRNEGGFTIQHEIHHNLGILITDLTRD